MYFTKAFVLSREERGEADLAVTFFTEQYGFLRGLALGVRKSAAKLRGHLEDFTCTDIYFVQGRSGYRLIGAMLADPFSRIGGSLERRAAAEAVASLVRAAMFAAGRDEVLWDALKDFFLALDASASLTAKDCERLVFWFAVRLLRLLGYQSSQDDAHSLMLRGLLGAYEVIPATQVSGLPFEPQDYETLRAGLLTACRSHLGFHAPFFERASGADIMV